MTKSPIHIGVGGWDFDPWRGTFYPDGLAKTRQLAFAAQHFTTTEINATFYGRQKPATFAKWAASVPPGFRFAVKASRYSTARKILAEGEDSIKLFLEQGFTELGDHLGPILWQFTPTKRFDPDDFAAFLAMLPAKQDGVPLQHALEVRHDSFKDPAFIALAKKAGTAIIFADSDDYPMIDEATADFAYARLQRTTEAHPTGYSPADLDAWAEKARSWAVGNRQTYVYFISGAKVRNPAAATALIERLAK